MNLALFDLDHTLLPIDSDHGWARFLGEIGVIDGASHQKTNDAFIAQYNAGELIIEEFLAFQLKPLADNPRGTLDKWHEQFMREVIGPQMRDSAKNLVKKHQLAGDLCAIVTASNEFVTRPIATAFGIEHLLAIELEQVDGQFTGRHVGVPSYREGKITRTENWLADLGHEMNQFEKTYFYSDSINDLPLLQIVSDPVATNPDNKLAAIAHKHGWSVLNLFD